MYITRGWPASGKTTWARNYVADNPGAVRINRDDFRKMLYGAPKTVLGHANEQAVTVAQHAAIEASLRAGSTVIVDDTNLRLRNARRLVDIAVKAGVEWHVEDFQVTLEECIERDNQRTDAVGEEVIRGIAQRFPYGQWQPVAPTERPTFPLRPYTPVPGTPRAIIVDVDGTLAHNNGHRDFYDYSEAMGQDTVHDDIANLITREWKAGFEVLIVTGRGEVEGAPITTAWLDRYGIPHDRVLTRFKNDMRKDYVVKSELFDEHIRDHYTVEYVLDDRSSVVDAWRAMGLRVLQVAEGNH